MKKIIDSLFTSLVILLPFLYQYKSPIDSIALGEILLIPFILYYIFSRKTITIDPRSYNGYFSYVMCTLLATVFASLQPFFSLIDFFTVFLRIIYYSMLIFVSYKHFNVKLGLKLCKYFTLLFAIYLIAQYISYKNFGVILPTIIDKSWVFLPEMGTRLDYELYYKYVYRPSSLFLEPSYYVLFASLGLAASLFCVDKANNNVNIIVSLIITISIVLSTSTLGILVLIVNWVLYFYNSFYIEKKKLSISKIIFLFAFCIFMSYLLLSPMAEMLISRTMSGGSFSTRILRGLLIARSLDLFQMLFGVGINNVSNYVLYYGISTPYDEINLNYVSSVIGTYVMSGILVFCLYIRVYLKSWTKNTTILSKILVILLFLYSTIEMNSFTYRFVFYFIFIVNAHQISQQETL